MELAVFVLVMVDGEPGQLCSHMVPKKGTATYAIKSVIRELDTPSTQTVDPQ